MKKIVRTLCLVAMVALVATSCKKQEENANVTVAFEETTGFEAGPSVDGAKAYIDVDHGSVFKWNDGDQIAYYNLSSDWNDSECTVLTAVKGSEGKTKTQFTGEVGAEKDKGYFVFFHPSKSAAAQGNGKLQGEDNRETFTIPATQVYKKKYRLDPTSLVLACKSPSVGVFTLQHIFGFLNIGIYRNNAISQVTSITVTDDHKYLAGVVNLKLDKVDTEVLRGMIDNLAQGDNDAYEYAFSTYVIQTLGYNASGESKTITLTCDAENGGLAQNAYTYFFIPLRPGALYNGFTVTINYSDNTHSSYHYTGTSYFIKPGGFTNVYAVTDGRWYDGGWVSSNK